MGERGTGGTSGTIGTIERIRKSDAEGGSANRRETFLDVRELLLRALDTARQVRGHLERLSPGDERTRLFVAVLVRRRNALESAVGEAMAEVGDDVLDQLVQYAGDPSFLVPEPPGDLDADAIGHWQNRCDAAMVRTLAELVPRIESPAARDFVAAVVRLIEGFDRQVALVQQSLRDV